MNVQMSTALYSGPTGPLYAAVMAKRKLMTVQNARAQFSQRIARLIRNKETNPEIEHTVVALRGQPVAVLVDIEWYRRMAAADGDPTEF